MAQRRTIALPLAFVLVLATAPARASHIHGLPHGRRGLPGRWCVPTRRRRFVICQAARCSWFPPSTRRTAGDHLRRVLPGSGVGAMVDLRVHRVVVHRDRRVIWRSRSTFDLASANGSAGSCVGAREGRVPGSPHPRPVRGGRWRGPTARRDERVARTVVGAGGPHHLHLLEHRRFDYRVRSPTERHHHPRHRHSARGSRREGDGTITAHSLYRQAASLERTDRSTTVGFASADLLGLRTYPAIYPLDGGLIELLSSNWHAVILRDDGSVFAKAFAPADGSSPGQRPVAAADGSAVAYVLTSGRAAATRHRVRTSAGDRTPRLSPSPARPRAKASPPSWHRSSALFADAERASSSIDPNRGAGTRSISRGCGDRLEVLGDKSSLRVAPHCRGGPPHVGFLGIGRTGDRRDDMQPGRVSGKRRSGLDPLQRSRRRGTPRRGPAEDCRGAREAGSPWPSRRRRSLHAVRSSASAGGGPGVAEDDHRGGRRLRSATRSLWSSATMRRPGRSRCPGSGGGVRAERPGTRTFEGLSFSLRQTEESRSITDAKRPETRRDLTRRADDPAAGRAGFRRLGSGGTLRPELPPRALRVRLRDALGLALMVEVLPTSFRCSFCEASL